MKIFRFFGHEENPAVAIASLPDTALLIQKRPFFIPDFTENCEAALCVAVRINRLGRSIHERFANRYYDISKLTLGVHFVAADLLAYQQQKHLPWDLAVGFDNSVAIADQSTFDFTQAHQVALQLCGVVQTFPIDVAHMQQIINQRIARISKYYTLRQGDVLLCPVSGQTTPVAIDEHLQLMINGTEVLSFNVK